MRRLALGLALAAAVLLLVALGSAHKALSAFNPCPGPYDYTPVGSNPDYIAVDAAGNNNGYVCVATSKQAKAQVVDDRTRKK